MVEKTKKTSQEIEKERMRRVEEQVSIAFNRILNKHKRFEKYLNKKGGK